MLNKKAITSQENALFKAELEKFRPHQNRILQAVHKQSSLMKELTRTYSDLLQDKRVRGEQNKYEAFSRQRNSVLGKYKKVYQAYNDLQAGLARAQQFYDEMKETVDSLKKNVESFVENRRSEGGQLLGAIEAAKGSGADREQARLKDLMERMSMSPSSSQQSHSPIPSLHDHQRNSSGHRPPPLQPQQSNYNSQSVYNPAGSPPITPRFQQTNGGGSTQSPASYPSFQQQQQQPPPTSYNPTQYGAMSPPAHQQYFSPPPNQQYHQNYQQQRPSTTQYSQHHQQQTYPAVPQGWQPPPPPPGPPPPMHQDYAGAMQGGQYPAGPGGYAQDPRRQQQQGPNGGGDPWAGLSSWK
jgi:hypothetical protein